MNFSLLADIESAFESFFTSLTSSISFNILFFVGLGLELFLIILFAVKSRFSYETRMRRSLDKLNRWLFKNKTLDKENIKEFSDMIKKAPKRLALNWQQYILYREKAPSQYMSVENIIEKPLRTSSFASNIKNLIYLSGVWALIMFVLGVSFNNISNTLINATLLISALIIPIFIAIMCTFTVIVMRARKNFNLDELYQNLHLFDRFIDNACVDLPPYIDYSLLFTAEEIDKGIPALREYLESRARKEKEEFDKIAQEESVSYEKYDFDSIGIDGQNILERAMKESEAFISKRDKTLAKVAQIEATLESLKKNFENIQKDFQKRMQVSKENIDRLRQQQEETTNRIESNFLRKQQNQEIAKQEKEEADFEQQKRRYLVEKSEYEEVIKTLNEEIESGRDVVEQAMMSEYETFYAKLFNSAYADAEQKVKDKISTLKTKTTDLEEDLTVKEVQLKRVIDENETLKQKLGLDYEQIQVETAEHQEVAVEANEAPEAETKEYVPIKPEELSKIVKEKSQEVKTELKQKKPKIDVEAKLREVEALSEVEPEIALSDEKLIESVENQESETPEFEGEQVTEADQSELTVEEYEPTQPIETDTFDFIVPETESPVEMAASEIKVDAAKRRGRPKKGQEKSLDDLITEKRSRGRPRKTPVETAKKVPGTRGRPVGSTKKPPVPAGEKRGRGRPKKEPDLSKINKMIDNEQKRLASMKAQIDSEIKQAISSLEAGSSRQERRDEILQEINELKKNVEQVKSQPNAGNEIEKINKRIEDLLNEIKSL